jgi:hypothetical protein
LTKETTATNLGIASAFALTETASKVKIGFVFVGTEYHSLVGVHDMTLAVSLKDYPSFDYFLEVQFNFKLTITSACNNANFGSITSQLKPSHVTNYNSADV